MIKGDLEAYREVIVAEVSNKESIRGRPFALNTPQMLKVLEIFSIKSYNSTKACFLLTGNGTSSDHAGCRETLSAGFYNLSKDRV